MPFRIVKSSSLESPTKVRPAYDLYKFLTGVGSLILSLAHLFQDKVILPVPVHRLPAFPVVPDAEVYLKAMDFTVSAVGTEENMMILYDLVGIIAFQEHAEVALLIVLVL